MRRAASARRTRFTRSLNSQWHFIYILLIIRYHIIYMLFKESVWILTISLQMSLCSYQIQSLKGLTSMGIDPALYILLKLSTAFYFLFNFLMNFTFF